jgi:hypothetical protein
LHPRPCPAGRAHGCRECASLAWLVGVEAYTVENIAAVITCARRAGVRRVALSHLSTEVSAPGRRLRGIGLEEHPSRERRATYWMDYGRALARVRRRDDAVMALRTAEELFPMRVLRNSFARDVIAELVAHSRRDSLGRELRGMAYRAGLPV